MTADANLMLTALQFADSAFPAGGFAFSWGLEGLAADGFIETAAEIADLAREHLACRWNSMDRVLLRWAHDAPDSAGIASADRRAEAAMLPAPIRAGSRRAGRALWGIAARLDQQRAIAYRAMLAEDDRLGHLPVAQGVVFRDAGLTRAMAEMLSGWAVISGLASAAMRLGLIGHVEAQHMATALRPMLADLLAADPPDPARLSSFTPLSDIAMMRGQSRHVRMFAT